MRFTKPAWVKHTDGTRDGSEKPLSIFSVHVHPDGSRIATGGLDAKIRIWSTKPILNQSSEHSNRPPKSLCTLTMHTGPVLTVRWAHSGRWLASGSDDEIVMIWDLDPNGAGKAWGSDEVNVEGWKALKRLPGHESDVTDLGWSPEDRYLASVGLDSKVMIWCGYTLERLRKLDQHQGFVKGVCWDPVGEFLATQSDDKTVKIWRTTDWGLEAEVKKPFEDSPGSTFFRRLSWSPDGAHITASNAMNNNGFVFVAAVITRNTWTSEISLVGHENTVEVAAYNPHIFLRNPSMPVVTSNICSVVALGADDRSISIWQTKSARPLIVAKEVFERQILDLSWSWDGLTLYAVSSDGTMGVFNFDKDELEGLSSREAQAQYLLKFGFVPPPLPDGFAHVTASTQQTVRAPTPQHARNGVQINGSDISRRATPPPTPPPPVSGQINGFGHSGHGGEHVTTLIARKAPKNKKRIQPTFMGSLGGSAGSSSYGVQNSNNIPSASVPTVSQSDKHISSNANIKLPPPPLQNFARPESTGSSLSAFAHPAEPSDSWMDVDPDFMPDSALDMDVPISSLDSRGKRRSSDLPDESGRSIKARTLGGDRLRESMSGSDVREIRSRAMIDTARFVGEPSGSSQLLEAPAVKNYLCCNADDSASTTSSTSGDVLEVRNADDGSPSEITFFQGKNVQWLDYLQSPVLLCAGSSRFCAVGMDDGTVNVYSHTGRRLMPTLLLPSPCAFLEGCKNHLLALTMTGQLYVWNVKEAKAVHPPVSINSLLASDPTTTIHTISIRPNGAPVIVLSNNLVLSYDASLLSFVKLSDAWFSQGSNYWKSRQRGSSTVESRGVVAGIEARITERTPQDSSLAEIPRPSWWTPAMTLGHLETRMNAARSLESAAEYKQALLLYAKTIADEGFRGKAEELLKELYGPVYWRPGRTDDNWASTVVGSNKRDLAKDVLAVFARSKTLYKLASDYQDLLKKSLLED